MKILINQQAIELPAQASVAHALQDLDLKPPYAVAVNTVFVPKSQYASQILSEGDRVEVISPVTGG
ncbi:sulfur carrier protein ThiS [Comamonas composti]|uniref:sulfur carrier protein ThiS n=1 Tax=Comamonas composti TaxID=408558 RepID=UPI0003FC98F6|nr:sulfur carrier protein ThiS [Comamonas composti]